MNNKQFTAIIATILIIGTPYAVREWVNLAQQIDRYEATKQKGLPPMYWGAVFGNTPRQ
jgi:hypothetical protein